MRIAFYKGTKTGLSGVYNKGVRWIEDGKYSHVEMIFSDGMSGSASFMDGGVRYKQIDYTKHPEDWDIIKCNWIDEDKARSTFNQLVGHPYDIRGNIHFILGFIKNNPNKMFCSGIAAMCIGMNNYYQYAPNGLYELVNYINKLK